MEGFCTSAALKMPRRHKKSSVAGGWINDAAAYLSGRVIRRVGLLHSAWWQAGPSCSSNGVKQEDGIWCPVRPQGCALVELRERPDGVSLTCLLPCFSASLQTSNDRHTVWLTVALSPSLAHWIQIESGWWWTNCACWPIAVPHQGFNLPPLTGKW